MQISNIFREFVKIEKVIIFGSRVLGCEKKGSDIDLAVVGEHVEQDLPQILDKLENDIPLPYYFDLVNYSGITSQELLEHIDKFGECLYKRS